jgi:hypothetical protein
MGRVSLIRILALGCLRFVTEIPVGNLFLTFGESGTVVPT